MSEIGATVYATALYDAAAAANRLADVQRDLAWFVAALAGNGDLGRALFNPSFPRERKELILRQLTASADPLLGGALQVLLHNNRLEALPDLERVFAERYQREQRELAVTLTTAVAIDDALADDLRAKLAAATGHTITMRRVVDPSIIGGVVLRVRDLLIDASVRRRLDGLRRALKAARLPASS